MQNANYLDHVSLNAIYSKIREAGKDKFARVWLSAGSSGLGKICQHVNLSVD
jgi:hypothetical protein